MNKVILSMYLLFLTLDLNANSSRYPLFHEYRLVNACIDNMSNGFVTKLIRNKCIKKVENVERDHSLYEIKELDKQQKLEELFED